MVEALRGIQVLPGPGEVLSVGPDATFDLHPEHDSLFVRECYGTRGCLMRLCAIPSPACTSVGTYTYTYVGGLLRLRLHTVQRRAVTH